MQILTLTENVCGVKPAVELNYSFTDDPEYKKKVRICVLCNSHVNFVHRFPTVYIKIFVVDLISLFSWLAFIHENFSLSEVSPTKIFPTNFFL